MWGEIAGSALSGGLSILGGLQQQSASAKEAKKNREFQERMYRNRYLYAMEDLERAGLNPILAGQIAGSTPSGSMAQMGNIGEGAARTIAGTASRRSTQKSEKQTRRLQEDQMDLINEQRNNAMAEWRRINQTTAKELALTEQAYTQSNVNTAKALNTMMGTKVMELSLPSAKAEAEFYQSEFGQMMRAVERVMGAGGLLGLLGVGAGAFGMSQRNKPTETFGTQETFDSEGGWKRTERRGTTRKGRR